jgi:hypothetical protein
MGCGGKSTTPVCKLTAINVFPATATADHNVVAPGNSQHFDAFAATTTPGCVTTLSNLTTLTWSVCDTTNVSISKCAGRDVRHSHLPGRNRRGSDRDGNRAGGRRNECEQNRLSAL